jgi:hypothetical protein
MLALHNTSELQLQCNHRFWQLYYIFLSDKTSCGVLVSIALPGCSLAVDIAKRLPLHAVSLGS